MPPVITIWEDDSVTPIDSGNPLALGMADKGTITPTVTFHIWNGKGDPSVDTAVAPKLYVTNGSGDASLLFAGTETNEHRSMVEARSCQASGIAGDMQEAWTPISPTSLLTLGDMPGNTMREIEIRLNVPPDAPDVPNVSFTLRTSF